MLTFDLQGNLVATEISYFPVKFHDTFNETLFSTFVFVFSD